MASVKDKAFTIRKQLAKTQWTLSKNDIIGTGTNCQF